MKPLLAEKVDLDHLRFPYLASVKIDGFRCLVGADGVPSTRSMKPIPNIYVQGKLREMGIPHLDGELVTYTNGKLDDFNVIQSKLASRSGMPEFELMVFDCFKHPSWGFKARLFQASETVEQLNSREPTRLTMVEHVEVHDLEQLLALEERALADKWEGLMLRSLEGRYKYGRSTVNEGILLKLKRMDDSEGRVVGVQQRMHNANEATTSALGYTERSSHKANMVATDSLGALTLEWRGTTFDVGTGFTEQQRQQLWREDLVGRTVTFAYQGVGSGGRPRFPRFKGFRSETDVS